MSWIKTYLINIFILIFSLFTAVVLVEIVLRNFIVPIPKPNHFSADVIKSDPLRGYKLVPNKNTIMSNGFFEEEIIVDKNGNRDVYSELLGDSGIVAIGDSQTFGHGIPAEDSWPEILQQKISKNVVNTGVFSYSPHQYLPTIDEQIANGLNVKTVLYAVTHNDILGGGGLKLSGDAKKKLGIKSLGNDTTTINPDRVLRLSLNYFRNRTALGQIIESAARTHIDFPIKYKKVDHIKGLKAFEAFISELRNQLSLRGIELHVVYIASGRYILPKSADLVFKIRDYDFRFIGDFLETNFDRVGISFADATDPLFEHSALHNFERDSLILPVDGHYNRSANIVIAKEFQRLLGLSDD
tara:strand:- start:356 stop:1420 length:1065 start_codon:yes stop_codon:yes gene_type:complete